MSARRLPPQLSGVWDGSTNGQYPNARRARATEANTEGACTCGRDSNGINNQDVEIQ